eukprot:scaffold20570_cov148-Skeletonema_menzelii.AAC.8
MRLVLFFLYLVLQNLSVEARSSDDDNDERSGEVLPPGQCGLYLAPSSLPFAGLGLFSGTSIPANTPLNNYIGGTYPGYNPNDPPLWTDIAIPIADDYKALPFRGQQLCPSWLGYVWPKHLGALVNLWNNQPFPTVQPGLPKMDPGLQLADGIEFFMDDYDEETQNDDDFEPSTRINAFSPGLASLANHDGDFVNIDRSYESSRVDYEGLKAPWDAGAGAFTPHHNMLYTAYIDVEKGMELFLDYGPKFHEHITKRNKQLRDIQGKKKRAVTGFADDISRDWDLMETQEKTQCPRELPTEKAKRERLKVGMGVDSSTLASDEKPYIEYRPNDHHPEDEEGDEEEYDNEEEDDDDKPDGWNVKPLEWLYDNGVCLSSGKLWIGNTTEDAGRALFATTGIAQGEIVLTSPLIALRRDDFRIYKSDPDAEHERDTVDKSTVIAEELLLNYAYGHPKSPMLFVPTAPMANFINHGGEEDANVQIRWPTAGSKTARLFDWAYNRQKEDIYDDKFESRNHNAWLKDHPIDVMEKSGKLAFEYVALREIKEDEEILIDYGSLWDDAWDEFVETDAYARSGYFRHPIGVPDGFYPDNWLDVSDKYEIAEIQDLENNPLEPGVALPMTWAHNGKALSPKYGYIVGLEKGFSDRFLEYSEGTGVIELYRKLLTEQEGFRLKSDQFTTYKTGVLANTSNASVEEMEFFAQKYKADEYKFNMHFVAAWNEAARKSIYEGLGDAGFDLAIKGIGERFGYDNITCFHASYMGMTHCDKAKPHSDIYATQDKSWNIVFPLITVEDTDPELSILAEDMNTVVGVHYLKDIGYAMGDFGYHQTRPSNYFDPARSDGEESAAPIRVVFGAYCSQVDETNIAMLRHIYDGDDPAPFADQFTELPMREVHWTKMGNATLRHPGGSGMTCEDEIAN